MASDVTSNQLVVIVGPTASGKSDAAMEVAKSHEGEIICADSRTVYKGLDIGTAKPSHEDRAAVPHHLLDVVEPGQAFSAGKFQRLANQAIDDIKQRGKLPIMVGGTGLFVDGVLFDYEFGAPADEAFRSRLEAKTVEELRNYCLERNIELPKNEQNKRHLVRAIEQRGVNHKRNQAQRNDAIVVGIAPYKTVLQRRIQVRAAAIFESGVVDEATDVAARFGWDAPGLSGNIYPILHQLVSGKIERSDAIERFIRTDWQLARRQMTWFRRNPAIRWCRSSQEANTFIDNYLADTP